MKRALTDWTFHLVLLGVTLCLYVIGLGFVFWSVSSEQMPPSLTAGLNPTRNSEIITAFHHAGLTAEVLRSATKDERDGWASWMVVEAIPFRISERDNERGLLLVFRDRTALEKMRAYYLELNDSLPRYRSWLFVRDNVLLQINGEVSEARANEYGQVLELLGEW